jgi:hypothetical protein
MHFWSHGYLLSHVPSQEGGGRLSGFWEEMKIASSFHSRSVHYTYADTLYTLGLENNGRVFGLLHLHGKEIQAPKNSPANNTMELGDFIWSLPAAFNKEPLSSSIQPAYLSSNACQNHW